MCPAACPGASSLSGYTQVSLILAPPTTPPPNPCGLALVCPVPSRQLCLQGVMKAGLRGVEPSPCLAQDADYW